MKTAFAVGALVACCPVLLHAQTKTAPAMAAKPAMAAPAMAPAGTMMGATVTPEMMAAQKDPNFMGSPAWWSTRSTADGKPLSADPRHS